MSLFSCSNCDVKFSSADIQREHYNSEFHRYNLKRRVLDLPTVTADEFQMRMIQIKAEETAASIGNLEEFHCNLCQKHFKTQKTWDSHLNSKKHKDNILKPHKNKNDIAYNEIEDDAKMVEVSPATQIVKEDNKSEDKMIEADNDDWDDIDEDWEEIPENPLTEKDCLFCAYVSADLVENLKHMSIAHSFFIPDAEYCIDLDGLIYYLGEKVSVYFMCLLCNERGKTFYSLDACRKHMIDKGHCQMLHEGIALAEYADYYDYSSSYPDKAGDFDIDEEVVPELLDGNEYELVLPSGAVIGHRSLLRYYKQRLNPNRIITPKKSDRKLHRLLHEYRSIGWTKTQQQLAARKARDIHVMKRIQSKWQMKLGTKANKMQHHFRQQVMF